jgi:hypothetical protein
MHVVLGDVVCLGLVDVSGAQQPSHAYHRASVCAEFAADCARELCVGRNTNALAAMKAVVRRVCRIRSPERGMPLIDGYLADRRGASGERPKGTKALVRPQPRRAAHTARVAVLILYDAGRHRIREHVAWQERRRFEPPGKFDMPPPSTITSGSSTLITEASPRHRRDSVRWPPSRSPHRASPPRRSPRSEGRPFARIPRSNAGPDKNVDAAELPAVARHAGGLIARHPGQLCPHSPAMVRPVQAAAVHHDAA